MDVFGVTATTTKTTTTKDDEDDTSSRVKKRKEVAKRRVEQDDDDDDTIRITYKYSTDKKVRAGKGERTRRSGVNVKSRRYVMGLLGFPLPFSSSRT